MNFDLMRSLLIDRALRGELFSNSNSIAAEEKTLNEVKETPLTIPNNWQWKRVADCVQFNPKVIQDDAAEVSFIPMADVEPGFVDHCSTRQIKLWAKVKKGFSRFQEGDLLVAKITPCFQNRKSCVANNLISGTGAGSTEFHVMRCVSDVDAKFLLYFFKSEYFIRYGVNHFNGTVGQQRVGAQDIKDCLIPVPPFDEQTRIVEKLEEAFAEIARAEKAYEELQTLAGVLRGQILQEAIEGKLVPQLAEEGVVEQIGAAPEEVPFEIPEKWKWYYLGSVIEYGKSNQVSGDEITSQTWVLDLEDIEKNTGRILEKKRGVPSTSNKNKFESGYVLYSKLRPYLNKVVVADEAGVCTTEIVPINVNGASVPLDAKYLQTYLMSPFFVNYANQASYGVKMPRLGTKDARAALIPIPPLEEQKRIVQKVVELLSQTDSLAGC